MGDVTPEEPVYSFGGLEIAPGNLYWNGSAWSIDEAWNSHNTYGIAYGVNSGVASTYFSFVNLGELFEKAGFTTTDGSIENLLDPLDGWRLPTQSELSTFVTTSSAIRLGSTVNGSSNKHYANIQLTGVSYADSDTPYGLLLFPDGETITGKAFSYMDASSLNTGFTVSDVNNYLAQGCVFVVCGGHVSDPSWSNTYNRLASATENSEVFSKAYYFRADASLISTTVSCNKSSFYHIARLVRPIE